MDSRRTDRPLGRFNWLNFPEGPSPARNAALVIARCQSRPNGRFRWLIRMEQSHDCDLTIALRMTEDNKSILDYYLLPRGDELSAKIRLAPENPLILDVYRFENLNFLYKVSRRTRIGDAA